MCLILLLASSDVRPILYSFRRCPYAIRARLALAYSATQVELRETMLRNKSAEFLQTSPKGTVPVLVIDQHHILEESLDILFWALSQHDPDDWRYASEPALQTLGHALIEENDHRFKHHLDHYKYADRFPESPKEAYRALGEGFLTKLEYRLAQQRYLLGKRLSFVDIAILPFVRQFAFVDQDWFSQSSYPYLIQWLEHFLSSDLFQGVMLKKQTRT